MRYDFHKICQAGARELKRVGHFNNHFGIKAYDSGKREVVGP